MNVLKTSIVSLSPQNFFYPFQALVIILLIKSLQSENNLIELEKEKEIVDMDKTQQQVRKGYFLRVYFVKCDTDAMSRIINLCLCAYLLCFTEKTH